MIPRGSSPCAIWAWTRSSAISRTWRSERWSARRLYPEPGPDHRVVGNSAYEQDRDEGERDFCDGVVVFSGRTTVGFGTLATLIDLTARRRAHGDCGRDRSAKQTHGIDPLKSRFGVNADSVTPLTGACNQATFSTSDVQKAQRVAALGIRLRQYGHSRVVSGAAVSLGLKRSMSLLTGKTTKK